MAVGVAAWAAAWVVAWVVALVAPAAAQGLSPGPLARDHAAIDDLRGCTRCHGAGDRVNPAGCFQCHAALGRRAAAGRGYHGRVRGQPCEDCHADHRGRGAPLVRWPGGAMDRFDHARLAGFALRGAHARVACRGCHQPSRLADAAVRGAPGAGRTFLGLSAACASCHADPHRPSLGAQCASCHDEDRWAGAAARFDHARARFPLRGAHARVACARCHTGATPGQPASYRGVAFGRCADCHRDPHGGRMGARDCAACHAESGWAPARFPRDEHAPGVFPLEGGHAGVACARCHGEHLARAVPRACADCHRDPHRPSLGAQCAGCHTPASWTGQVRTRGGAFHDRTAFPLTGLHAGVACARCHDPRAPAARRYRPLAHARCADCHRDPHRGELAHRAGGGACEPCHDTAGFRPARFEAADHAATRFALEGAHLAVPCASCHPRPPAAPGFRRDARACEACHADPHGGQFAGRAGGCAACHAAAGWAPARFGRAEHAATRFPLAGAHDAPCARCHAPAAFVGTARDCGACHADAHAGQFRGTPCASCHAGASFRPATGFDHAATRFPLRNRHAAAACGTCHRPAELPTGARAAVYRLGAVVGCARCHEGGHGDRAGRGRARALAQATAGCAGCHDDGSWRMTAGAARAGFDHLLTGAALVGAHDAVGCGDCHGARGAGAALTDCARCHADRHSGQLGGECARCHATRSWTPDATLADHRRTRFPLVGAHAVQGCVACHPRVGAGDFRDATPDCAACHQETLRARQPHPPHVGALQSRCERCHSQLDWRPAYFDHGAFWPLTGAHAGVACGRCHEGGRYAGTARECVGCHDGDQARARIDHRLFPDARRCDRCHTTVAWVPATFDHDLLFPLRGPHGGLACAACHTDPANLRAYSCVDCHAHRRDATDREHREVRGYVYESRACRMCHPNGRAED